jgi:hypothetical protein
VLVIVVAVVGVGVGIAFLAAHGSGGTPPPVVSQTPPDAGTSHQTQASALPKEGVTPSIAPLPATTEVKSIAMPAPPHTSPIAPATNTLASETNWEDKIDDIVGSEDADTNKVKQLFSLFPTLPPDGQEEAAQHLSNLVEDENYAPLGDLLKNDKLPEGVLDELLADLLNRPNNLKLPLLLDVASDANHAKHDEAKDLLELYLGDDYGSDWNVWQQHMTNWLQQNPD